MNGAHDMGGMDGFGPVEREADEPIFHAEWERRALALTIAMGFQGLWNIDTSRYARENRDPLGYTGRQGEDMMVLENTPEVHNMVVCTLCSCYPRTVLGLPPVWYKASPYRAGVVKEPRKVLAEFGVTLPEAVEIRVWDSTAEIRYLVLPQRPAGSEALDQVALAALVTRDSMIGTGLVLAPDAARAEVEAAQ